MFTDNQPIVAVASGNIDAAIAVIRISGNQLSSLLNPTIQCSWVARQAQLAKIYDKDGNVIDRAIVIFFPAPSSYTGQDVVEIHCHGGGFIKRTIVATVQRLGVRLAEAGEFTKRALVNGKLDLAQAEGVGQLVAAQTRGQWQAAHNLMFGNLHRQIDDLRAQLLQALSLLNALIDFPDERETQVEQRDVIVNSLKATTEIIARLIASYQQGQIAQNGLRLVLSGAPNVGKSSLLNLLLGKERAIVAQQAGTTRDYLEDTLLLDGRLFKIVDTAGIRATDDAIEQQGVARSKTMIANCDLVCLLSSATDQTPSLNIASKAKVITVLNKIDLCPEKTSTCDLVISCKTGAGIDNLRQRLCAEFDNSVQPLAGEAFISCQRHLVALEKALQHLQEAQTELANDSYEECIAASIQRGLNDIEEIIGKVTADEVLGEIFAKFCIGK